MSQMQEDIVLRKGLFGYNRDDVDRYLDELNDNHNDKLKEMKNKIIHLKLENTRLKKEIEDLKREIEEQMKSDEFMSFSQDKANELIPIMSKHISDRVAKIEELYKEQEIIFNRKIEEFNSTIRNTQNQLNSLLKTVLVKSETFEENVKSFIDENSSYKDLVNKAGKLIDENEEIEYKHIEEKYLESQYHTFKEHEFDKMPVEESKEKELGEDIKVFNAAKTEEESSSNNIRYKYLIGKIVGQDVLNSQDAVIAPKDTVITSEIVETVEREGKLADLVINMKMPNSNN